MHTMIESKFKRYMLRGMREGSTGNRCFFFLWLVNWYGECNGEDWDV